MPSMYLLILEVHQYGNNGFLDSLALTTSCEQDSGQVSRHTREGHEAKSQIEVYSNGYYAFIDYDKSTTNKSVKANEVPWPIPQTSRLESCSTLRW